MPIEKTLERVDALVAAGDLDGARTRLVSLADHAPRRLDVRERLADVYRRTGNRQEAGRWGYLSEQTSPEELRAFAKAHRGDARSMMRALRWEGAEDGTGSQVAEERLRALRATAEDDAGGTVDWRDPRPEPVPGPWWGDVIAVAVLGGLVACLVVGAVTIVRWLVGLVW
ncbi:DUF6584 family protein [Cellulomonas hominis]|uniref:DUF6584 family protein n=1 Tax=Cellulomonas hominis TaxID=156981 RepID=UPI001B8EA42F|nr:DUF6584 family protein [Cellulomonas hominis]VTR76697.1 hypothetical protein CHMI_01460 [Cellulomonas hominis]